MKDSDSNTPKGVLDLGLTSFLEGIPVELKEKGGVAEDLAEVLRRSVNQELDKSIIDLKSQTKDSKLEINPIINPIDQYKKLAEACNWSALSQVCEKDLAQSNDQNIDAKLWWLKGQFMSGAVPASILSTTLDTTTRTIENVNITSLSPEESRLVGQQRSLAAELLMDLSKALTSPLDRDLAEAFKERAIRFAPEKLNILSESNHSSFVIFEDNKDKTDSTTAKSIDVQSFKKKDTKKTTIFIGFWLGLLLLIICGVLAFYLFHKMWDLAVGGKIMLQASEAVILNEQTAMLEQPPIERLAGLGQLDALYYDMAKSESVLSQKLPNKSNTKQNPDYINSDAAHIALNIPPQPILPNTQPESKAKIDTQYPKEPADRYDNNISNSQIENGEQPEIDFPPFRSNSQKRRDTQSSNRNGEYYQLYVIIARTKILEEPSYWAYSLGDLFEGDKVEVEDNLGKWLKIHTRKGRVGYILSQDATRF